MIIRYDPEADALRIVFRETTVTTKHLAEGIAADYDSEGRVGRVVLPVWFGAGRAGSVSLRRRGGWYVMCRGPLAKGDVAGNRQDENPPLCHNKWYPSVVVKPFHSSFSIPQNYFQSTTLLL